MKTRSEEEIPADAPGKVSYLGEGTETHLDPGMRAPESLLGPRTAKAQELVAEAIEAEAPPVEEVKCDGEHGEPPCEDPECWLKEPPVEPPTEPPPE